MSCPRSQTQEVWSCRPAQVCLKPKSPFSPLGLPASSLLPAALRDKPGAPQALTQLHLRDSRWAPALLCLPLHISDHELCHPFSGHRAPGRSFSPARVCFLGAPCRFAPGPGGLPAPLRYPQAGHNLVAWDGRRCQRTGGPAGQETRPGDVQTQGEQGLSPRGPRRQP